MQQYPSRPLTHNLESLSDRFVRNQLPHEWIVDKPTDYGIDYKVEIVSDGFVTGHNFSIQLKAHEKIRKGGPITISLERTTINLYLNRLEPILLICFIADRKEAYYRWFDDKTVDLTRKNKSFTLHFDADKKISTTSWDAIIDHVKAIFGRKFMLNTLPEINFSDMGSDDEKAASAHYIEGNYEIAEHLFKKLNTKQPNSGWLNSIAMCQYALFRYKEALATINKALTLTSDHAFWVNKACILAEFGIEINNKAMLLEASSLFKKASDKFSDAHYFYNYANTSAHLGEFELAESNYKKCLKLRPNYAQAWKNLGQLYSGRNKLKQEMACYDNALAIDPYLPQALFSKGILLIKDIKQYNAGIDYINRAKQSDRLLFLKYEGSYFWFSFAYFQINDPVTALDYLQQGLDQYPGNPYLLNLKRQYYQDNWRNSEMLRNEAKVFLLYRLGLSPNDMLSLEILCRIYLSENYKTGAIEQIRQHTAMLSKSSIDLLTAEDIGLEDFLSSLYHYVEYCNFRVQHLLQKEINTDVSPSIYLEMTELVGLKIFHDSVEFCEKYRNLKTFESGLIQLMLKIAVSYYPKTAVYFITAPVEKTELFAHQLAEMITGLPELAMKECARINGYLTAKLKLNNEKMSAALAKADEKGAISQIRGDSLDLIQERYHFFKDN